MWHVIKWWYNFRGQDLNNRWVEYQGYRRAVGGRWGLWEIKLNGLFKMWIPSACEHFPPPILSTHTEPLEIESYI